MKNARLWERHACKVAGCIDALLQLSVDHEVVKTVAGEGIEQTFFVEIRATIRIDRSFRTDRCIDEWNARIAIEIVGVEHEPSALLHQPAERADQQQRVSRHLQPPQAEYDVEPAADRLLRTVDAVGDEFST